MVTKSEIEEFWVMENSEDADIRMEGSQKWAEFSKEYPHYFESIMHNFTNKFCEVYKEIKFHDFRIDKIHYALDESSGHPTIDMVIFDYHEDYEKDFYLKFTYNDVKAYSINVQETQSHLAWNADIFEIMDDGFIKHRILCHGGSIVIIFKNIKVEQMESVLVSS